MATNDNLGDFLTGVANAIRTKKGTSGAINAQNFASEIASIQTGSNTQVISASVTSGTTSKTIACDFSPTDIIAVAYDTNGSLGDSDDRRCISVKCYRYKMKSSGSTLSSFKGYYSDAYYHSRYGLMNDPVEYNITVHWNGSQVTINFGYETATGLSIFVIQNETTTYGADPTTF